METVLLRTKLFRPQSRSSLVVRPRLFERLDLTLSHKLTLVAAPAGFGKSTLVSSWLAQIETPSAWISLDASDNDPSRFFNYLIAALREIDLPGAAESGRAAEDALHTAQPPPPESLMVLLINELSTWPMPFVVVLDDYHLIEDAQIHDAIEFLLSHMPSQMHLILTSRSDPPLPLPRLRTRQQLNYLTSSDLRFTLEETAALFNKVMRLGLASEDIAHLEARSEGWIASLQLAAAALIADPEPIEQRRVIDAFAGDDRHIIDYLMSEVLQRQPGYIQDFLLQTSILTQLNVRLCNAVTGQVGSQPILETLDQANLFVVPLDNKRQWYRYHQLFAEFLRSRLVRTEGISVSDLHAKAAHWYAEQGFVDEAIEHALEAGDAKLAARLLEDHGTAKLWSQGQMATVLQWLDRLPVEERDRRPYLAQARAWSLFGMGEWDELDRYLPTVTIAAERAQEAPDSDTIRAALPGQNEVLWAELTLFRGKMKEAERFINEALALLDDTDLVTRSMVLQSQGYIYRLQGDVTLARKALIESSSISATTGNLSSRIFALTDLAEVQIMAGDLEGANHTLTDAFDLASESEVGPTLMIGCPHITFGHLLWERNMLAEAERHLNLGLDLSRQSGFKGYMRQAHLYLAQIAQAKREPGLTEQHMVDARRLSSNANTPWIAERVAMYDASIRLAQGRIDDASLWAHAVLDDSFERKHVPRYQRHLEHVLAAHVLIAAGVYDDAAAALTRCEIDAETNDWDYSQIRISTLKALLNHRLGKQIAAAQSLHVALDLAAPQACRRPFLDAGTPIVDLLEEAVERDVQRSFAQDLLDALALTVPLAEDESPTANEALDEPLTDRELEILQLIAAGHSNRQIGEQLYIAIGTVGKHTSNIFLKLDAANRAAAVLRAQELGLL